VTFTVIGGPTCSLGSETSPERWNDRLDGALTRSLLGRIALAALLAAAGCSKSSDTSPSPIVQTTTITITAIGVTPKNIQVAVGSRVMFVNNDTRSHSMNSDPHPEHTDCPEINQVGFLSPGQSRETGNLVTARTCGFHDHDNFADTSLQGTITIQ
jgi:plastocyanin